MLEHGGGREDPRRGVGSALPQVEWSSLVPYLPAAIVRRLAERDWSPLPPFERVRGACLHLDIAGFTPIVVSLSESGPRGIEALQRLLSRYLTEAIDRLRERGGDIYQFAGDSIVACFERARGESDLQCLLRAADCAGHVQYKLAHFSEVKLLGKSFCLSSRVGIGFGDCQRIVLGDAEQWLHPALVGEPVAEAVLAEKRCASGEVMLGPQAAGMLPRGALGKARTGGFLPVTARSASAPGSGANPIAAGPLALAQCSRFIHPALLRKGLSPHQVFAGDFRDLTCLFLKVSTRGDTSSSGRFVTDLNEFFTFVQRESTLHQAVLLMTDFSDKGNVLLVVFGAPTALENKEALACHLAIKLLEEQAQFSFIERLCLGVASGPAYWGEMGAPSRKGCWALGEVVNIAARLMSHETKSGLLVDASTERKVRHQFSSEFLREADLKGVARRVPVYRVRPAQSRTLPSTPHGELVGRRSELRMLTDLLSASARGSGSACLLSGEAGIGKSRVSAQILRQAEAQSTVALHGVCYSYESFTPFFPWKQLLRELCHVRQGERDDVCLERVEQALSVGGDAQWAPVLGGILGFAVEEDRRTAELDARRKNQRLSEVILRLLKRRCAASPLLLFFEDAHWMDQTSLDLLSYVCTEIDSLNVLALITLRPGKVLESLAPLPGVRQVGLRQLGEQEVRELLRQRLGHNSPSRALEDLLVARGQGNPFFIESLVEGLAEQGLLSSNADSDQEMGRRLAEVKIPESIQDVVLSRIDRLPERENVIVKIASVIGRVFRRDALNQLLPGDIDTAQASLALTRLEELGLLIRESEHPDTCLFKHVVIRDVAYNTLLVSGREQLHRRLAQYLEQAIDGGGVSAGVLAYHFLAGGAEAKGLHYTLVAARAAKSQYANAEAIHHYARALSVLSAVRDVDANRVSSWRREVTQELAETRLQAGAYEGAIEMFQRCMVDGESPSRKAEIHVGLGRAFQEQGQSKRAIEELERALCLLGRGAPRSFLGLVLGTLGQGSLHLLALAAPVVLRPVRGDRLPTFLRQLTTLISLIKIYFFVDLAKVTWATLVAMNMAARSRSDYAQSLASCYYGTLLFGAGLLRRSERYLARALEYGRRSRDAVAEAVALSRMGTLAIFSNQPERALQVEEQAIALLRQVGERWEVQTCLMMLATSHFLLGRFCEAERYYLEMGALGVELKARMHQGWAHAWVPMCRYLRGEGEAARHRTELEEGLSISIAVEDLANQCACLNHLSNMAVREEQVEQAAQLAVRAFASVWRYHVLVPFLQVGLVDAAEAALFALEREASSVPKKKLWRVVRRALFKASLLARVYPYLAGPTLRVKARAIALQRGARAAEPHVRRALLQAERAPNVWERGVAYHDAALVLPHRRAEFVARAREIFLSIDAKAELRRLERLSVEAPTRAGGVCAPAPAALTAD